MLWDQVWDKDHNLLGLQILVALFVLWIALCLVFFLSPFLSTFLSHSEFRVCFVECMDYWGFTIYIYIYIYANIKCPFGLGWKLRMRLLFHVIFFVFFLSAATFWLFYCEYSVLVHCLRFQKLHFLTIFSLKMGLTVLFTQ